MPITRMELAAIDSAGLWPLFPILVTDDGSPVLLWDGHSSYYAWVDCDGSIAMGTSAAYFHCVASHGNVCPIHDAAP
jgi:hypothetical protein